MFIISKYEFTVTKGNVQIFDCYNLIKPILVPFDERLVEHNEMKVGYQWVTNVPSANLAFQCKRNFISNKKICQNSLDFTLFMEPLWISHPLKIRIC